MLKVENALLYIVCMLLQYCEVDALAYGWTRVQYEWCVSSGSESGVCPCDERRYECTDERSE